MTGQWPTAPLDQVRRLRVLATGVRGAHVAERVIHADFERVWGRLSDFENLNPQKRSITITSVDGERLELLARNRFGMRARLRGVYRPGWCWLQSRFLLIGMAARAEADGGTTVALTGGIRVPGRAAVVPFGARAELRKALDRLADDLEA